VEGLEKAGELPFASSLCGACEEVCPVKIPIPLLLRRLRDESYSIDPGSILPGHGYKQNLAERLAWKGWELMNTHPGIYRLAVTMLGIFGKSLPAKGPLGPWTRFRVIPKTAPRSLHSMAEEEQIADE
jgi:L-lactate dehydrogenase complex protein LldF